jgi:hypothetical protein
LLARKWIVCHKKLRQKALIFCFYTCWSIFWVYWWFPCTLIQFCCRLYSVYLENKLGFCDRKSKANVFQIDEKNKSYTNCWNKFATKQTHTHTCTPNQFDTFFARKAAQATQSFSNFTRPTDDVNQSER